MANLGELKKDNINIKATVEIEVNGVIVKLSIDDIKELQDKLNNLLNDESKPVERIYVHLPYIPYEYWYPYRSPYEYWYPVRYYPSLDFTWTSSSANLLEKSSDVNSCNYCFSP